MHKARMRNKLSKLHSIPFNTVQLVDINMPPHAAMLNFSIPEGHSLPKCFVQPWVVAIAGQGAWPGYGSETNLSNTTNPKRSNYISRSD